MADFVGIGMLGAIVASAAIGVGRRVLERRRARRELRDKPALASGSPEGTWVRVTGVVRATEQTLAAPLSRRECVVFRARITGGRGGLTRRAWPPREQLAMVPFVIDRGAEGSVAIEGKHALLDLPPLKLPDVRWRKPSDERARRERFALAQGVSLRDAARSIYEETVVEPGMTVSVAGVMMKDPVLAPAPHELGFRDAPPSPLRLAGNLEHPLVIGVAIDVTSADRKDS